jgi:hypothetical protein
MRQVAPLEQKANDLRFKNTVRPQDRMSSEVCIVNTPGNKH